MKVPNSNKKDFNAIKREEAERTQANQHNHGSLNTPVATIQRSSETGYAKRFMDIPDNKNFQYLIVRVQTNGAFSVEDDLQTYFITEKVGNRIRIRETTSSMFPGQGKISYPHSSSEKLNSKQYYIVNVASIVATTHAVTSENKKGEPEYTTDLLTIRNPDGNHYMTTQQTLQPVNFNNSNDILSTLMPVLRITKDAFDSDKKHFGYIQADSLSKEFKSSSDYRDFIDVNRHLKDSFLLKVKGIDDLFGPFEVDDDYDLRPVEIRSGFPYIYQTPADVFRELPSHTHLYNYRLNKMYVNNKRVICFMADDDIIENCIDQYFTGQEKDKAREDLQRTNQISQENIGFVEKALKYHQGKEDFFYIPTITKSIMSRLKKNVIPDVHEEVKVTNDKKQELLIQELQNHNRSLLESYILLEKERNEINQQLVSLEMESREKLRRMKKDSTKKEKEYDELKYKNDKKIDTLQKRVAELEIQLHRVQSLNSKNSQVSEISQSELAQLELEILNKQKSLEELQNNIEIKQHSLQTLEQKTVDVIEHYKQDQQDLVNKLLEFSPMVNILTDVLPLSNKAKKTKVDPNKYLVPTNTKAAHLLSTLDKQQLRNKMISHAYNYLLREQFWIEPKNLAIFISSIGQGLMTTLYGKPGSGKTSLALMLSEIFQLNNSFKRIPIPHGLQSGDDFIGFVDPSTNTFKPHHNGFYELLQLASDLKEYPDTKPVIALLDEANLSRMEYYLSDFIIDWDRKDIDLTHITGANYNKKPLVLSNNFKIIATLNSDETKNPIPLRIRDRMNYVRLETFDTGRAPKTNDVFVDDELEFSYTMLDDAFAQPQPADDQYPETLIRVATELQLSIRRKNSWNRLFYGIKDLELNDQKIFRDDLEALDFSFRASSLHTLDVSTEEKSRMVQNILNTNDYIVSYNTLRSQQGY